MKNLLFVLSIVILIIIPSCEKDEDIISPVAEKRSDVSPAFKQQLTAEIKSDRQDVIMPDGFINEISGPAVISNPGIYKVVNSFNVDSGDGIIINSSWVLLWVGNHTITGPGNKEGRGVVVNQAQNVLVYGGRFQTFGTGVSVENSSTTAVKSVRIRGGDEFADPPAVPPQIGILLLNSSSNIVAGNDLKLINLGIFVRGSESRNNKILLNRVKGGKNGLLAICYNPPPNGTGGPSNDEIFFNDLRRFPIGIQTNTEASNNRFTYNKIFYFDQPWEDLNGTNIFAHNRTVQISP